MGLGRRGEPALDLLVHIGKISFDHSRPVHDIANLVQTGKQRVVLGDPLCATFDQSLGLLSISGEQDIDLLLVLVDALQIAGKLGRHICCQCLLQAFVLGQFFGNESL